MKATMKSQKTPIVERGLMILAATLGLIACDRTDTASNQEANQSLYATKTGNFRLSLTDAPNDEIKSVFVNVKHAELRLEGKGKEARVIAAENFGLVDLLTLQNGVTLPMADLNLPTDVMITQIRLVLDSEGNYLVKSDGSVCNLQTPSQQKTGIKFLIHGGVLIEKGFSYSIVADFDAKKSIVLQGNGGCLLKPVLKLKSASKIQVPPPADGSNDGDDDGSDDGTVDDGATPTPTPEPVTNGAEVNPAPSPTPAPEPVVEGTDGQDSGTVTPPASPDESLPVSDPVSDGDDTSSDLGAMPTESTQSGDASGWDTTPENSEVPVISEPDLNYYFNNF